MRSVIMGWERVEILKADYEARLNKKRVENVSTGNFDKVSKRDVITNKE